MRLAATVLVLAGLAAPLAAQVGHAPADSPYRDVQSTATFQPFAAYMQGDGGILTIGPHRGWMYGVRVDVRTNKFLQLGFAVSQGSLERNIVNPFVKVADRLTGPVSQLVTIAEAGFQFNITGNKTWHRLGPYAGITAGVAFGSSTPADTSLYDFGKRFTVTPVIGVRIFLTPTTHLRIEVGSSYWQLQYPPAFRAEPPLDPGTNGKSNAVIQDGRVDEWVSTPRLLVGLAFPFPL